MLAGGPAWCPSIRTKGRVAQPTESRESLNLLCLGCPTQAGVAWVGIFVTHHKLGHKGLDHTSQTRLQRVLYAAQYALGTEAVPGSP